MNTLTPNAMSAYTIHSAPADIYRNERHYVRKTGTSELLPCRDIGEAGEIAKLLSDRPSLYSEFIWRELPDKTTLENISK